MADRWIYSRDGRRAFYQTGEVIYAANDNRRAFTYEAGSWVDVNTGSADYFVSDVWVFGSEGTPIFYYG